MDKIYSVIRITDQREIAKFMETFKPNNPYHIERYLSLHKGGLRYGLIAQPGQSDCQMVEALNQ